MRIHRKLLSIQTKLKAPKNQFNNFGKYKYRNCEDILEAVKPLLLEEACTLHIRDEIVNVGNRYYVKAIASLVDIENGEMVTTEALAREEESKRGMDGSQVTGASSSYARKYALNGLFCIDDTKDSDTTNTGDNKDNKTDEEVQKEKDEHNKLQKEIDAIDKLAKELASSGIDKKIIGEKIKQFHIQNNKPSGNYNSIKDIRIAQKVFEILKTLKKPEDK